MMEVCLDLLFSPKPFRIQSIFLSKKQKQFFTAFGKWFNFMASQFFI
jgi:hypothetical protein